MEVWYNFFCNRSLHDFFPCIIKKESGELVWSGSNIVPDITLIGLENIHFFARTLVSFFSSSVSQIKISNGKKIMGQPPQVCVFKGRKGAREI